MRAWALGFMLLLLVGCNGQPFAQHTTGAGGGGSTSSETGAGGPGSGGDGSGASGPTGSSSGGAGGEAGSGGGTPCQADLAHDPLNCGACGRSCLGTSCQNGLCAPSLIAQEQALSIAASDAVVVWGTATGARKAALDGSGPGGVPLGVAAGVPSVAASSSHTFFITEGGASVFMLDAQASSLQVNQPATAPVLLAADEGHVYWADGNGHAGVWVLDVSTLVLIQVAYPQTALGAIGPVDGSVCWTSGTGSAGTIHCTDASSEGSGPGSLVLQGLDMPCSVAGGAGKLYWVECPGQDSVHGAASDGSGAMALAGMSSAAVATDASYVYWADHGVMRRAPKGGGSIEPRGVASGNKITHLAVGPDRVYFTTPLAIFWVAK